MSVTSPTAGQYALSKITLNNYKIGDQFKASCRLCDSSLAARQWYIGPEPNWFNPEILEELCTLDAELCKLAEDAKDLDPVKLNLLKIKIFRVFTQQYVPIIISKFKKILSDLTNYFTAKADYGGLFEADRRDFKESHKKCPFDEVESSNVHQL